MVKISKKIKLFIPGSLMFLGYTLYMFSYIIASELGWSSCDRIIIHPTPIDCFDSITTPLGFLFSFGIILFLLGIYSLFHNYLRDNELRQKLFYFSKRYILISLLFIPFGFIPVKVCYGFLGCSDVYFLWHIILTVIVGYLVALQIELIFPRIHLLLKIIIALVATSLTFYIFSLHSF